MQWPHGIQIVMDDHLDLQIEQAGEVTGLIGLYVEASVIHLPQQSAKRCGQPV